MGWLAPPTVVTGGFITAAYGNAYIRDNPQYLFNILNNVQAQTNGINVRQDSNASNHGVQAITADGVSHSVGIWVDASGNGHLVVDGVTALLLNAGGGSATFPGPLLINGTLNGVTSIDGVASPPISGTTVIHQTTAGSLFGNSGNGFFPYFTAPVTAGKSYFCFAFLPYLTSTDGSNRHKGYFYVGNPDHVNIGDAFTYGEAGTGVNTNNLYAWGTITATASTMECGFNQISGTGAGTAQMSPSFNGAITVNASLTVMQVG